MVETFHTRTRHFLGQVAERRIIVIDSVHQRLLDRLHPFRLQRHFSDQRIQYAQRIQRLVALSGQHRRKRSGSPLMCMVRQLVTTACPVCKRTEFPYFLKHQRRHITSEVDREQPGGMAGSLVIHRITFDISVNDALRHIRHIDKKNCRLVVLLQLAVIGRIGGNGRPFQWEMLANRPDHLFYRQCAAVVKVALYTSYLTVDR